jgi:hypothetical protein
MISDDQIVTKESTWEDMKPRIVRKFTDLSEQRWISLGHQDFWHESLYQTLKLFPKDTAAFWEPHIWSPMNKVKFIEMCKKYDYKHNIACITQSLYYNYINQPIVNNFDHIHLLNSSRGIREVETLNLKTVKRHLSWTDKPFEKKEFRDLLDMIVGFKPPKDIPVVSSNKSKTVNSIIKLRKDIQEGKVIKVPTVNGFIWKRVK